MTWISQRVLTAISKQAETDLSRGKVADATALDGKQLDTCLLKLRRLGLVALEDKRYSLTPAGRAFLDSDKRITSGPRGPQPGKRLFKGTLRERAWHAMRIRRKFTLAEIQELCARGEERDAESNLGKYVRALAKTGFITALRTRAPGTAPTSNGLKRYLMVNDTGPQAPRWLPLRGMVYDPNTEKEHAT